MMLGLLGGASAVVLLLVVTGHAGRHRDAGLPGPGPRLDTGAPATPPGTYALRAGDTSLVVLDGVSGRIQVTADPRAHAVTGTFHPADGPGATRGLRGAVVHDAATGADALAVGCRDAAGAQVRCAGDLVLTVPRHTGLRLRQASGQTVLDGLGGDVTVDASSVQLTATGLEPVRARFTVASGSADVAFSGVPQDVDLQEVSASVAVRLPRSPDGYAVTTAATSASTQVAVPRNASSAHRISVSVTSGSLDVTAEG
ncbi:hypothetical protein SAMN05216267_100257 [Actinacidiphila rubida]|uniref:Adhesin domain-containing protein n=1 Tax=Actinacidiphila rubida TaxID=310780 RepID=A0A1H8E7D9_9ACTN|nr:hypothetical protein [Actinacidiphila rubida]SEN15469.1 hypothetical protein SAMN05216267_100257 [Actinacidiphila rubida]